MTNYQWQIREQLTANQPAISIRELLQRQWFLPNRFVHYLRSRRQVLVNGKYQPMNTEVHPGDQVM